MEKETETKVTNHVGSCETATCHREKGATRLFRASCSWSAPRSSQASLRLRDESLRKALGSKSPGHKPLGLPGRSQGAQGVSMYKLRRLGQKVGFGRDGARERGERGGWEAGLLPGPRPPHLCARALPPFSSQGP